MSHTLADLLNLIRQHPGFEELKNDFVERPVVRPYGPKDAAQIENSRAQWIYQSGQLAQHECWVAMLTGNQE